MFWALLQRVFNHRLTLSKEKPHSGWREKTPRRPLSVTSTTREASLVRTHDDDRAQHGYRIESQNLLADGRLPADWLLVVPRLKAAGMYGRGGAWTKTVNSGRVSVNQAGMCFNGRRGDARNIGWRRPSFPTFFYGDLGREMGVRDEQPPPTSSAPADL